MGLYVPLLEFNQLAKTGHDKFAVLLNLFVGKLTERIEEYSNGSLVGLGQPRSGLRPSDLVGPQQISHRLHLEAKRIWVRYSFFPGVINGAVHAWLQADSSGSPSIAERTRAAIAS
ncbi:MAG: hypothetical protein QOH31_7203 [Verrucomicrobiota bacterium]